MPLSDVLFEFQNRLGAVARSCVKFWLYINIHNITPCGLEYKEM